MKRISLAFFIVMLFALSSLAQDDGASKAPVIALKDLTGKIVRLSDFKGKVVLLNFWATWCVPCAAEIPELVKWQKDYKSEGLQVIGVAYPPASATKVRRFARQNKINYPVLFGFKATKKLFEPNDTLPVTIIIGKNGNVVDRIEGIIFADEFENKVKPLLRKSTISPPVSRTSNRRGNPRSSTRRCRLIRHGDTKQGGPAGLILRSKEQH
jgi:thiol-disulfide isomerase/thioredoxin